MKLQTASGEIIAGFCIDSNRNSLPRCAPAGLPRGLSLWPCLPSHPEGAMQPFSIIGSRCGEEEVKLELEEKEEEENASAVGWWMTAAVAACEKRASN